MEFKRIDQARTKINPDNAYETVSCKFIDTFITKVKYHVKTDGKERDLDLDFMLSCYSRMNAFDGITDYQDHSKKSKKELKELLFTSIKKHHRTLQLANYYNYDGTLVTDILLTGRRGGWDALFIYKDGKNYFSFIVDERKRKRLERKNK